MPPQAQFRRAGRLRMSSGDRATLRQLAVQLAQTPRRWKAIAESEFGRRLGLDHRQLRHALKSKAYQPCTAPASWSAALQAALVAEVTSRGRAWASIRRDGASGAFAAFNVETLRRNYDHPARHRVGYSLGGRRMRGMTRLPGGRFRVTFRERLLGQCNDLAQAARMWIDAARAAGVPDERLNVVPDDDVADEADGEGEAVQAASSDGNATASDHAQRMMQQRRTHSGAGVEEEEVLGARILGALAAQPRLMR